MGIPKHYTPQQEADILCKAKRCLDYDAQTGIFTRKHAAGNRQAMSVAGSMNNHGYLLIKFDGVRIQSHRLAWLIVYGSFPKNEIDHINMSKHDNRISNLREATTSENQRNKPISPLNTTGVNGVSYLSARHKFLAQLKIDGKNNFIGHFDDLNDAEKAVKSFRSAHHGMFTNHGHVPGEARV